jgi:hypothetical protein
MSGYLFFEKISCAGILGSSKNVGLVRVVKSTDAIAGCNSVWETDCSYGRLLIAQQLASRLLHLIKL